MTDPSSHYLKTAANLLATDLLPEDAYGKKLAKYCYRMLTVLRLRKETLPELQMDCLGKLEKMLDRLIAELQKSDGHMILAPELVCNIRSKPNFEKAEKNLQAAVRMMLDRPTPESQRIQREIAEILYGLEEAFLRHMNESDFQPPSEPTKSDPLSAEQKKSLHNYLRQRFPGDTQLEIEQITMIIAGGSKQTLIVKLKNTTELPPSIVLRMDQAGGVVNSKVSDEFNLIKTIHDAGVTSPKAIALETDEAVLGAPFMVVSHVDGKNIGDWEEVLEPSRDFAMDLAQALARLHNIAPETVRVSIPGSNVTVRERLLAELASYERHWRAYGQASVGLEQAYAWLRDNIDLGDGVRAIVHCDIGCHNMLGKEGRLTALLDWETAVIGNPAQDLAYVRHTILQMMPFEDFLEEYEKSGGHIPSPQTLIFYRLWRNVMVMHYELMARSYFLSGHHNSLILGYSSQHVYQRSIHELHETLHLIYQRE